MWECGCAGVQECGCAGVGDYGLSIFVQKQTILMTFVMFSVKNGLCMY